MACPSGSALEADVTRITGQSLFRTDGEVDVVVHGSVDARPDGSVAAHLEARRADGMLLGTRSLSASEGECASLREPIGLVLAMLLESVETAPRVVESAPTRTRRLGLGVSLGLLSGALPRAGWGIGAALTRDLKPRLRLRTDAAYWLPVVVETPDGQGAQLQAASVALRVCTPLWRKNGKSRLSTCGGAQLLTLLARPRGLAGEPHQLRVLPQGLVELRASVELRRHWAVEAACGPIVSWNRPRFSYQHPDGTDVYVYRPAVLGVIFQLGLIRTGL